MLRASRSSIRAKIYCTIGYRITPGRDSLLAATASISSPGIAQDSAETVLPNGSLIATTSNGELYLLGSNDRWCRVSVSGMSSYFGPYLVPGRTHVYYKYFDKGGTILGSIGDTQIRCS